MTINWLTKEKRKKSKDRNVSPQFNNDMYLIEYSYTDC